MSRIVLEITGDSSGAIQAVTLVEQKLNSAANSVTAAGKRMQDSIRMPGAAEPGAGLNAVNIQMARLTQTATSASERMLGMTYSLKSMDPTNLAYVATSMARIAINASAAGSSASAMGTVLAKLAPMLAVAGQAAVGFGVAIAGWNLGKWLGEVTGIGPAIGEAIAGLKQIREEAALTEAAAIAARKGLTDSQRAAAAAVGYTLEQMIVFSNEARKFQETAGLGFSDLAKRLAKDAIKSVGDMGTVYTVTAVELRRRAEEDALKLAKSHDVTIKKIAETQIETVAALQDWQTENFRMAEEQRLAISKSTADEMIGDVNRVVAAQVVATMWFARTAGVTGYGLGPGPAVVIPNLEAPPVSQPGSPIGYANYAQPGGGTPSSGVVSIVNANVAINAGAIVDPANVRAAAALLGSEIAKQTARNQITVIG
jgi:hypothetical protein